MKQTNYKQKIITKIDELLQKASDNYCAYCNNLEELKDSPKKYLDTNYTNRVHNLLQATYDIMSQINLLLCILFESKRLFIFEISSFHELEDYEKNKRISISYYKIEEPYETRKYYKLYNPKTGKLESFNEIKSTAL